MDFKQYNPEEVQSMFDTEQNSEELNKITSVSGKTTNIT